MPHMVELAGIRDRPRHGLRIGLMIGVGVITLALICVGIYGLTNGPKRLHPTGISMTASRPFPDSQNRRPSAPVHPQPLPNTSKATIFAPAVIEALFTWDTASGIDLAGYEQPLITAADPSGTDAPGLIHDLSNYFPSSSSWSTLQEYQTRQSVTIGRLYIPDQWRQAVAADSGHVQDGVVAYTVEATRHRTGLWLEKPVSSEHPVSFTMFLACPPATRQCVLLRLSKLNDPLH
ncbi:hypothetical protein [Rathayibacter soli]|uniref:hypothetical protein n=1 Tax=Rathayibacter soli TaxID=3144168 RepID=UPI0027E49708|nr:hypothetical protein [Glaciibacter superstes]